MKRFFILTCSLAVTFAVIVSGNLFAETNEGIRHVKVGELDFYCVQDAPSELNTNVLLTEDKELLQRLAPTGRDPGSINVFVVRKGSEAVLIDTGNGGKMLERLKTPGIKPEDVKTVLLTHTHFDHVGGLVKNGNKVFPNAEIRISATEWEFWKSNPNKELCEQVEKLYGKPKFLTPDEKTAVVFPELVAVDLSGHTPGQVGFLLASGNEKLIVVADLLHCGSIQLERPDISCRYDVDPKQAAETRIKTLKRAAEEKWIVAASHLPFPSLGTVSVDGDAFRFASLQSPKKKIERFEFNGAYSSAVRVNGEYLYLAGIIAAEETGDISVQTKEVLNKIESLLEKYGSDKNHVLSATVHLKDIGDFKEFNAAWQEFFHQDHLPARTTVQAQMVRPGCLIEITVTAVLK